MKEVKQQRISEDHFKIDIGDQTWHMYRTTKGRWAAQRWGNGLEHPITWRHTFGDLVYRLVDYSGCERMYDCLYRTELIDQEIPCTYIDRYILFKDVLIEKSQTTYNIMWKMGTMVANDETEALMLAWNVSLYKV